MSFVHEDPEFGDLVQVVAAARGIAPSLVEKDYWVTHTLWALEHAGLEVWFKGGTSLSKGFGLIERFSEDLDLKLEPGSAAVPAVTNWKSEGTQATAMRRAYFEALANVLVVPGARVELAPFNEKAVRAAELRVRYPGRLLGELAEVVKPFVLLEVGSARVTPFVRRDMTSFVHEHLTAIGELHAFEENLPKHVRCVHPLVTMLEKLDAIMKRLPREEAAPATFVRHFEDAARIAASAARLPPLDDYPTLRALAEEMLAERQIARLPSAAEPAFHPDDSVRWVDVRAAHAANAAIHWGPRASIDQACEVIREWVGAAL